MRLLIAVATLVGIPLWLQAVIADKWIVVTTIQSPTEALKRLAQLDDWQLLVVGDKKTPTDWYLDEKTIYLSAEDQETLPYALCTLLPWNHYARKNIGYLYAIEHGAKIIYETDDDNYVIEKINVFQNKPTVTLESNNPVINVYSYFGQPRIWPRGYPLAYVTKSHEYSIMHQQNTKKVVIEQGLINNEPDLDALFRLTRYDNSDIYFDSVKKPCVLQVGNFCPFNTQNTIFHKEAFWALYIPSHVPFRVCDIWRGYIVQRLLWETDHALCFTQPTAIQERNIHDFMKDFEGEQDLYLKTHNLLTFLLHWNCNERNSPILIKGSKLYKDLIAQGFIGSQEEALFQAWIYDLNRVIANSAKI